MHLDLPQPWGLTPSSPVIEETITKSASKGHELKGQVAIVAARAGTVALAIIFSGLFLLIGAVAGAYVAYKKLSDSHKCTYQKDHLVTANVNMKQSEELTKLKAATEFYKSERKDLSEQLNETEESVSSQITEKHFVQEMTNDIKLSSKEAIKQYQERCKKCNLEVNTDVMTALTNLKETAEEARQEFKDKLSVFVNALAIEVPEGNPEKVAEANQKIIAAFRDVLKTPAYQALKYNAADPAIQFLHQFAASIWTEVKVLDAYQEFGKKALQEKIPPASSGTTGKPKDVNEAIELSIENVSRDLFQVRRLADFIMYSVTHPLQTLNSMMSEGGKARFIAKVAGGKDYDPHGRLSNNPSLQGTTVVDMTSSDKAGIVKINNVYGGSPTIGDDEVAPEFLAVLQAAENNQLDPDNRIEGIPDKVFYTNFQSLGKKHGENPRSVTIMKLNAQFPLSFLGISLSKDSKFYHTDKAESNEPFDENSYGNEMLKHLSDDSSFLLTDRASKNENDQGFYFPPDNKEEWKGIFKTVIDQAKITFADVKAKEGDGPNELKGAFQELVYASLQHYLELKLTKELIDKGVANPSLHSQRACKENIDRGGAANAAYLHLRLGLDEEMSQDEKNQLITGALHCRALGARDRMILPDRLPQVLAFMKYITPEQFWAGQKALEAGLGLETSSTSFKPGLPPPVPTSS